MEKSKIFLTEDNPTEGFLLKLALSSNKNIDAHLFQNGKEILEKISENPDIIIMDLNLPDYNGIDLIEKIQKINPNIRFIVVSSQEDVKTIARAQSLGIANYLVKSNSTLNLLKTIIDDQLLILKYKKLEQEDQVE